MFIELRLKNHGNCLYSLVAIPQTLTLRKPLNCPKPLNPPTKNLIPSYTLDPQSSKPAMPPRLPAHLSSTRKLKITKHTAQGKSKRLWKSGRPTTRRSGRSSIQAPLFPWSSIRPPYGFKRCLLEVFRFHSGLQRSLKKDFEDKVCGLCGVLYGPMGTGVSSILRLG